MTYTKQTLQQDLAAMGLTGTETILIHSSMKSIGAVEGGADTVLDALMEFFAEGLLLLPTHTWSRRIWTVAQRKTRNLATRRASCATRTSFFE